MKPGDGGELHAGSVPGWGNRVRVWCQHLRLRPGWGPLPTSTGRAHRPLLGSTQWAPPDSLGLPSLPSASLSSSGEVLSFPPAAALGRVVLEGLARAG